MFTSFQLFSIDLSNSLTIGFDSVSFVFFTCINLYFDFNFRSCLIACLIFDGNLKVFGFLIFCSYFRCLYNGFALVIFTVATARMFLHTKSSDPSGLTAKVTLYVPTGYLEKSILIFEPNSFTYSFLPFTI